MQFSHKLKIMRKKIQPIPNSQYLHSNEDDICQQELQIIDQDPQYQNHQLQIQLDYDQLLKNRITRDKKSNIRFKLSSQKQHKKTKKPAKQKKKQKRYDQIDTKDITDIIIIILLVLILGISLFRVVLEVQIQYKKSEQLYQHQRKDFKSISDPNDHNQNSQKIQPISTVNNVPTQEQQVPIVLSPECQSHINQVLKQHGNLYDFRLPYEYMSIKSKVNTYSESKNTQINRQQYSEAVSLLGIVHNVNENGTLTLKDDPCETQALKRERLEKTMSQQFNRLNSKYQIDSYHQKQLPFCLVVNSYNNARNGLIYRNIDSILQQNYTNYHVVYTDDCSTDETGLKVKKYLEQKNIPESKFTVTMNSVKIGMMHNIYSAIYKGCQQGQIVVMIDGDDSFIGTNILSLLNAIYQKDKIALLWSNFVCIFNNNQVSMGFSRDYTEKQKTEGNFRKLKGFISSHLKTFFVDVFKKIDSKDLQTNDGKFYGGASDTAMMLPMIEMTNSKFIYLPQVLYEYRYDTGQIGNIVNKVPQKQALKKIFSSRSYQKLEDFSFIQKAIENAMIIPKVQKMVQINVNPSTAKTPQQHQIADSKSL